MLDITLCGGIGGISVWIFIILVGIIGINYYKYNKNINNNKDNKNKNNTKNNKNNKDNKDNKDIKDNILLKHSFYFFEYCVNGWFLFIKWRRRSQNEISIQNNLNYTKKKSNLFRFLVILNRLRQLSVFIFITIITIDIPMYSILKKSYGSYLHQYSWVNTIYLSIYLSMYLYMYLSMYVSIFISIYVCIYLSHSNIYIDLTSI
jgi:hypothetical protein